MALIKSISGIRGTIGGKAGDNLTPEDIVACSAAFGQWIISKTGNPKVVIGRDARISGPIVSGLVINTLRSLGIHVVDLGLSTTPTVEMAVPAEKAGGGIIFTAYSTQITTGYSYNQFCWVLILRSSIQQTALGAFSLTIPKNIRCKLICVLL